MTVALVGSANAFGFADGDTGHTCTHATGAPNTDDLDVLLINSNTVLDSVTSSAGAAWTQRVDATSNQGAYIYSRKATGGEPATVVVDTNGPHNTDVIWLRFSGTNAYSASSFAQANNSNGTTLPALTTGTLAASGMLLVAAGLLHNFDGTLSASPVWTNSFTAAGSTSSGVDGSSTATVAFGAYKLNVGTASEDVGGSLSWTNNARNRYVVFAAFTAAAGGAAVNIDGSLTATGTRTATAAIDRPITASTTSTATLTTTAAVDRAASASLAGTGTITLTAAVDRAAAASLSSTGTISATGAVDRVAAASLTATGTAASTAAVDRPTDSSLTGTATIAAAGAVDRAAAGTLTATAALTSAGAVTGAATASFTAIATISASAAQPDVRASSAATNSTRRTSTSAVTGRRTSTPTVTGG